MLKTPTRPKRSLECDGHYDDMENDDFNGTSLAFASKRLCIDPFTPHKQQKSNVGVFSSLANSQNQDGGGLEEKSDEDMDVGDEIVSNFNTISFDSSMLEVPQSNFPVFPPLQRSGRKIDDLVDEVIRKSTRYNPESLHLTIPPNDFEFHMPSHVSVCGSPTRDARYISSPENRNLALTAIYNVTSPPALDKPKLIQFGDISVPLNSQEHDAEMQATTSSSAAQYHLGDVTHSDWFENSSRGHDDNMYSGGVGLQSPLSRNKVPTNGYRRAYNHDDSDDENCEDMYIDS